MTQKQIVIFLVSLAIAVILTAGFAWIFSWSQAQPMGNPVSSVSFPSYQYLLKAAGDTIGVYQPDGHLLYRLEGVIFSTLPEADQQSLKQGIPVKDDAALRQLVEDLTS